MFEYKKYYKAFKKSEFYDLNTNFEQINKFLNSTIDLPLKFIREHIKREEDVYYITGLEYGRFVEAIETSTKFSFDGHGITKEYLLYKLFYLWIDIKSTITLYTPIPTFRIELHDLTTHKITCR